MRVLVTGSKGFVGHWLTAHLEEMGDHVVGVDTEVDVTDATALSGAVTDARPDAICHLAARASVGASYASSAETYRVNVIGTVNLLDAAAACEQRPRVLVVSSSEVYGKAARTELPLREDHPFAPVSPYAASKAAAEMAAVQAWLGAGVEVVRVRPFNHTGPGQTPAFVVPALAEQVARAAASGAGELRTGNLEARRDISDVRDVVRAYRLLLLDGEPGQVYNVCRGESVVIADIARRLLQLAGIDVPLVPDPARFRPVDVPEFRGDPRRLEARTGWRAEIDLETTLRDVLAHWQERVSSA